MEIHTIRVGPIRTNCYLVADEKTKETIIIDPGDNPGKILNAIKEHDLKPKQIVLTHTHFDHTGAVEEMKKLFNIKVENKDLEIIKTPGHSSDGISIVIEDSIFTGDTLFKNAIGRTDLQGSDPVKIHESLKKLLEYPDYYKVYPGHGPASTIGEEKQNNPFLNL